MIIMKQYNHFESFEFIYLYIIENMYFFFNQQNRQSILGWGKMNVSVWQRVHKKDYKPILPFTHFWISSMSQQTFDSSLVLSQSSSHLSGIDYY